MSVRKPNYMILSRVVFGTRTTRLRIILENNGSSTVQRYRTAVEKSYVQDKTVIERGVYVVVLLL